MKEILLVHPNMCPCEEELQDTLKILRPLRIKFFKELRGNISELLDYELSKPKGFYIYTQSRSYLLGKYIKVSNNKDSIDSLLISEIFVLGQYRNQFYAGSMLQHIINYSKEIKQPILLGCSKFLTRFYNKFGFKSIIMSDIVSNDFRLMVYGNRETVKQLKEILN